MALRPINQPVRERQVQAGKKSGNNTGALLGAGLGAVLGTVAAPGAGTAAGASAGAAAMGALSGAGAGAGLGGLIGGAVQPGQQQLVQQEQIAQVPTQRLARAAEELQAGIRSLNQFPDLASKYTGPLTQSYLSAHAELKRRSA